MQIFLFVVIGFIAWFGGRPLLSTIQTKMDDIQKSSVIREHREKQLRRLPELEAQHHLIDENNEQLSIILTKDRLVEFIETLERLATSEGVIIEIESRDNAFLESKVTATDKKENTQNRQLVQSVDKENATNETTKRGPVTKEVGIIADLPLKKFLKLTITATGKYGDVVRYLQHVENLPYALDIISLNIKEHPTDGDLVASESGALNPFGEEVLLQLQESRVSTLDVVFDTIVYMKE